MCSDLTYAFRSFLMQISYLHLVLNSSEAKMTPTTCQRYKRQQQSNTENLLLHTVVYNVKDPLCTYSTKLPAQNRKPITFRLYEVKHAFYLNIKMIHISGLISILNTFGSKQTEEAIVSKVFSYVTDIYWWSKNWGSCSDKYENT